MSEPPPFRQHADDSLFHLLVESVQDYAIFALDPEGRIATWNRGVQKIKGYAPDEVIGRHFSLFFPEEDRRAGKPTRLLREAAEQGRTEDEGWRVRRDGTRFWANVVITALRDEEGSLVGFAKVTRDLTERRAAEQALLERERQLSDAQELAGLGSWEWDVRSDRVTWTDAMYRIFGLEPERFDGTFAAYLERVHPDDRDQARAGIEEVLRAGGTFRIEERIVRPDGEVRTLRSNGRAVRDDSGATTRVAGAALDITELKRAQEQAVELARVQSARDAAEGAAAQLRFLVRAGEVLASSLDYEETLRNVARLAVPEVADWCAVDLVQPDGTLRRVAVAHPDPRRVELAKRFVERYPPRRDAPTGPWRVIDSGQPEHYPDIPDELLQATATDSEQLAMIRELGIRSAVTVPLGSRSGVLGTLSLVQAESGRRLGETDVWLARELGRHAGAAIENARLHGELAEQNQRLQEQSMELEMQAEELQAQAAQLEEVLAELQERTTEAEAANRAKSEFLATMSHELRTPLNAIFGYAELLQMGLHGPVTGKQTEALERIKRNQRSLLVIINDVLNFARLEAGRIEISMRDVAIAEVIGELENLIGPQLHAKGVHYRCEPCGTQVVAHGDRERIEQILLNLLTNAVKFTDRGGEVSLEVETGDEAVRIHVRDTGRGIPADRLGSIFDPFVQIDRQVGGTEEQGVGLGLAISRSLAEAMGGTLTVESEVGRGSTFTLTLRSAPTA